MQNLIAQKFQSLKNEEQLAFLSYIMAGDPNLEATKKLLPIIAEYADIIELGFPFSDPTADGLTIQHAAKRALKNDIKIKDFFALTQEFRQKNSTTPIIMMGYYNPILQYGVQKFAEDAIKSGINGVIVVDLPLEEQAEFAQYAKPLGLNIIQLIAPTSDEARIKKIASEAEGFIYYVMVKGVTGTKEADIEEIKTHIDLIKKYASVPVISGFGIKTPAKVQQIKRSLNIDGFVIGSEIVKKLENFTDEGNLGDIKKFLKSIKQEC